MKPTKSDLLRHAEVLEVTTATNPNVRKTVRESASFAAQFMRDVAGAERAVLPAGERLILDPLEDE